MGEFSVCLLLAALTHVYHFCKGRGEGKGIPRVSRSCTLERGRRVLSLSQYCDTESCVWYATNITN